MSADLRQRRPKDASDNVSEAAPTADPAGEEPVARRRHTGIFSFDFAFLLVATVVVIFTVKHFDLLTPSRTVLLTKEELAAFNGESGAPLYVAILGEVYDVSKGERYYGKEKGYYCFVGRDATRAYVTGEFVKDQTDEVQDLNAEQHGGLVDWREFYRSHEEYRYVGRVVGAFYDDSGQPTSALKAVEDGANQALEIQALREAAKKLNPTCNSKWAQGKGGEVWCSEGYPRKITEFFPGAAEKQRCACFQEMETSHQRQLYDDCAPEATRCVIPPKETS